MERIETWKPIKGYEGYYAISNYGNVMSLMFRNNRLSKPKLSIVRQTDNGNGYLIVSLNINGKRKNHCVHRLVAEHFIENPKGLKCVNHKDYDKKNNVFTNLEWCTQKENVNYSIEALYQRNHITSNTGEKHISYRNGRYCFSIKRKNCKMYRNFMTLEEAIEFRNEVIK